jgi:CBS domain-containing protein
MVVQDLLDRKGAQVVTISPDETVLDAAHKMNTHRIGALVVCEPARGCVGIFTERDVLRRVLAEGRSPDTTRIADVMTTPVTCCKPDTPVQECREVMTNKRLRHLPVVDGTMLVGIISIGDLLATEVETQQSTIEYLHTYMNSWM